jgi:hypothetical protein
MAEANKPVIGVDQLLTLALNGLDTYFFRANKEKARKMYKEIADGEIVDFVSLTFKDADKTKVKLKLSLDHREFDGHLTFHLFKIALQQMLRNIANKLAKKEDLNIFTSEETREFIVHIPGVIQDREKINVLVLGIAPARQSAVIKLQFLDADQFKKQPDPGVETHQVGADEAADRDSEAANS